MHDGKDEDAAQDAASWHWQGTEAAALPDGCDPAVRPVVRGVLTEPA